MATLNRLRSIHPPMSLRRALLIGLAASAVYPLVAVAFARAVGPSFSDGGLVGYFTFVIFTLGSIGVPAVLWLRFEYRGPVALMALMVVLLTFVVPLLAPRSGDAPAFALAIYWAPYYLVLYALMAGGEYLYRRWRVSRGSVGG
jgi:hypothetical protein